MSYVHTTSEGDKIALDEMTTDHLKATVRLIERKVDKGVHVAQGGGDPWEPDSLWYDEESLSPNEALEHYDYHEYVAELQRRGQMSFAKYQRVTTVNDEEVYIYNTLYTDEPVIHAKW